MPSPDHLQALVGRVLTRAGETWEVLDILPQSPPRIVVRARNGHPAVQSSQWGEGRRRAPPVLTLPLYTSTGMQPHPECRLWMLAEGCSLAAYLSAADAV